MGILLAKGIDRDEERWMAVENAAFRCCHEVLAGYSYQGERLFKGGVQWADDNPKSPWKYPWDKPEQYKPVIAAIEVHAADGSTSYDTVQAFLNADGQLIAYGYNHANERITHKVVAYMNLPKFEKQ